MRFTFGLLTPVACVAALLTPAAHHRLIANGENRPALAGQITSSEEGPLELVTRSRHEAHGCVVVIERMSGYPPLAFPLMPQRTPAPRIGGGPVAAERQQQAWRRQAEYLSGVNLSAGAQWTYPFKTLPR